MPRIRDDVLEVNQYLETFGERKGSRKVSGTAITSCGRLRKDGRVPRSGYFGVRSR